MAGEDSFLSRWSRRKSESKDPSRAQPPEPVREAAVPVPAAASAAPAEPAPLPPVDSLTPESDFTPFMAPEVDGDLRRKALKTLFSDPQFNVMDMMDVYVDDYSKPDPIPESWMEKLEQLSRLGDRAGRDREEAERKQALADAQGGTRAGPLASPSELSPPAAPTEVASDAGQAEVDGKSPNSGIPAPPVGE
jgi:hypothetical protein